MVTYRIISNGDSFKIQKRVLLFFWITIQRPENLDNKDFGGDLSFSSKEEAKNHIRNIEEKPWVVVS